jgi:hypothetical protein
LATLADFTLSQSSDAAEITKIFVFQPKKEASTMSKVEAKNDTSNTVTITLDGDTGHIIVKSKDGKGIADIHDFGILYTGGGTQTFYLGRNSRTTDLQLGGNGVPGVICVSPASETIGGLIHQPIGTIHLDGQDGVISLRKGKQSTIVLNSKLGNMQLGGGGTGAPAGDLFVLPADGNNATIHLAGQDGVISLMQDNGQERLRLDGHWGDILLGGNGEGGGFFVYPKSANNIGDLSQASIIVDGESRRIALKNSDGTEIIGLQPAAGVLGESGRIALKNDLGNEIICLQPVAGFAPVVNPNDLGLVTSDAGQIVLSNFTGVNTVILDGAHGDIVLQNADCAEEFDIAAAENVEPGTVMVLDQEGKLQQSREAYDKKVAGVISGAGDYKPGIVLDKQHSQNKRLPVALVGKVYCKVDAESSPIAVGDVLTTSSTPGHAMKACDPLRAFGAVIGKALRPIIAGQGLIPILIALQ